MFSTLLVTKLFGAWAKGQLGTPFPLYVFAGLTCWNFFARGMARGTASVRSQHSLIREVYFPRLLLPIAAVLTGTIDLLMSLLCLTVLMYVHQGVPDPSRLIFMPFVLLLLALFTAGVSTWFSVLDARYQDFRYLLPYLTQLLMITTPVFYPVSSISPAMRGYFALNPLATILDLFRWTTLGTVLPAPRATQLPARR